MEQKEIISKISGTTEDISENINYIKGLADIYNLLAVCEFRRIFDTPYTENMFFSLFYFQHLIADRIRNDTEQLCDLCNSLKDNG